MKILYAILLLVSAAVTQAATAGPAVLVFSKTTGFRHESIAAGIEAIKQLGEQHGFRVVATEDATTFSAAKLQPYAAVIFLNTTGDILNREQQDAFERYIRTGHGFVGIHSAADTEYEWLWYGRLVGGWFDGHDAIQDATIIPAHSFGSATPPAPWVRKDEWYNYKNFDRGVNVIYKLDTKTFKGSNHRADHPIAWYRDVDGGRSFYTGFGHTIESYSEPAFLAHVLDGVRYAMGSDASAR